MSLGPIPPDDRTDANRQGHGLRGELFAMAVEPEDIRAVGVAKAT